jgi:hypothetical protein
MMGSSHGHKKPYMKALFFGLISVGLYAALLLNQETLNNTFGKGGVYAFLPIIAAFVFSFVHGTFTGDFWTVMGVEAAKKIKGGK